MSVALLDPSGAFVRGSLSAEQSSQILIGEFPRFAKPGKSSNYDGRIRVLVERVDNDARLPKPDLCVTMHLDLRIMQAPKVDTSLFVPNVSLPGVDSAVLGLLESSYSVLRSKSHFQDHHVLLRGAVMATTYATRLVGSASTALSFQYASVWDGPRSKVLTRTFRHQFDSTKR